MQLTDTEKCVWQVVDFSGSDEAVRIRWLLGFRESESPEKTAERVRSNCAGW